jgi:hypothetical protein
MKVLLIFIFLSGCTTFSSTSNKVNPPPTTIITIVEEDIDSYEEVEEVSPPRLGKILEGFMPSYLLF